MQGSCAMVPSLRPYSGSQWVMVVLHFCDVGDAQGFSQAEQGAHLLSPMISEVIRPRF